jgi:hypothetical protein
MLLASRPIPSLEGRSLHLSGSCSSIYLAWVTLTRAYGPVSTCFPADQGKKIAPQVKEVAAKVGGGGCQLHVKVIAAYAEI